MNQNFEFNTRHMIMLGLIVVLVLVLGYRQLHPRQTAQDDQSVNPDCQDDQSCYGNRLPGGQTIGNCRDCVAFKDIGVPVESDTGEYVDAKLGAKLSKLAQINSNWRVTEGYPPTVRHLNFCHQNGICIDLGLYPEKRTAAKLSQLCKDALDAGLTIINEYSDPNLFLIDSACPDSNIFETTTGGHLHVQ